MRGVKADVKAIVNQLYHPFRRRLPPGSAPGTLVPPLESSPSQIDVIAYSDGQLTEQPVENVAELEPILSANDVTWVNVNGLGTIETLKQVATLFDLHALAMEDVVHVHQRPKVEQYEDHVYVVLRMALQEEGPRTEQLSLFLGRGFVVTFQERPGDGFDPVRRRIRKKSGRIREAGADYLAYALLDAVVDGYFPLLETFGTRLDEVDARMPNELNSGTLSAIHAIRRDLLGLRRVTQPLREAIYLLQRNVGETFTAETRPYLRDLYDHAVHIADVVEFYREGCSELREYFYALMGQRTNDVMKLLTMIATVFIPTSFIAGVYGMNFDAEASPWNMPELSWRYGYPFALGLMLAVAAGLVVYFWRQGWLRD